MFKQIKHNVQLKFTSISTQHQRQVFLFVKICTIVIESMHNVDGDNLIYE